MVFWLFLVVLVGGFIFAVGNASYLRFNSEQLLRQWATEKGFRVLELDLIADRPGTPRRYTNIPIEAFVVLVDAEGKERFGQLTWKYGFFEISRIHFSETKKVLREEQRPRGLDRGISETRLANLYVTDDGEAALLNEVNRRLDRITSQAGWMEPYDLDGSGHVDEQEWAALRTKIMAEVRGEMGQPGDPADGGSKLPDPVLEDEEVLW